MDQWLHAIVSAIIQNDLNEKAFTLVRAKAFDHVLLFSRGLYDFG